LFYAIYFLEFGLKVNDAMSQGYYSGVIGNADVGKLILPWFGGL
jgi:hypothetical protein